MTGSSITTCTNSDWGADLETCHFQMGFYLKFVNGKFLWNSYLQKTTALSSIEAEYMALSDCTHQVIWIKQMFGGLRYNVKPTSICGNHQGSIFMANNPITECCTKHMYPNPLPLCMQCCYQPAHRELLYQRDWQPCQYVHQEPQICQIQAV